MKIVSCLMNGNPNGSRSGHLMDRPNGNLAAGCFGPKRALPIFDGYYWAKVCANVQWLLTPSEEKCNQCLVLCSNNFYK